MSNFWQELKKQHASRGVSGDREPIVVLAPMADVTDAAFRRIIAKYGKPDVMWTEFVSADGLCRANAVGKRKLMRDLLYDESERPIVAQLFSSNPEYMYTAAKLVAEMGFDGLDINMGCPDKGVEKQGAGAALIKNPQQARAVLRAAMEGVADGAGVSDVAGGRVHGDAAIPVSVKTRIGYNKNELEEWLPELLAEKPAMITIHARTRKEMSDVPARWEHVARAVEIRDALKSETLIFGNGDVPDVEDGKKKAHESGADGVMLGRAIFGNPWLFSHLNTDKSAEYGYFSGENLLDTNLLAAELARQSSLKQVLAAQISVPTISTEQKLRVMTEHAKLFEELLGDVKNFAVMKKHFKAYVSGFDGAGELRAKLMETNTAQEVENIVDNFLTSKKANI